MFWIEYKKFVSKQQDDAETQCLHASQCNVTDMDPAQHEFTNILLCEDNSIDTGLFAN